MKNTTLVTGLWNIGRGDLTEGWSRSFDTYLNKFEELLKSSLLLHKPRDNRKELVLIWKYIVQKTNVLGSTTLHASLLRAQVVVSRARVVCFHIIHRRSR